MIWVMFLQSSVFCSIFCLMPWSWFSARAALEYQSMQLRCTVRYLWGHNNLVMLTIFSVFALKKEGILEGYLSEIWSESPWLYSPLCIPFSRATVCFCKAYCTFAPYASSLYSSTTNCLSVLYIVIYLQPRLCCITATEIYHKTPLSCVLYKTFHRPGLNYSVGPSRGCM